jgi:hypothetical protein
MIENSGPKLCQLDDDLVFSTRRRDDPTKFRSSTDAELEHMFERMEEHLDNYAHVGVSHREGANRETAYYKYATRMLRVLAYRTDIFLAEGVRFDRLQEMVDFDVTLQLLKKGYTNCVLNGWVSNQSGSDVSGGCSTYRTAETHADAARRLATMHSPFVKVVKKVTKNSWCADEKGERTDVRVQWKQAYYSSGQTNLLDRRKVQYFGKETGGAAPTVE